MVTVMSRPPEHFFIDSVGNMYDMRRDGWHLLPPLRARFRYHVRDCRNTHDLRAMIRTCYVWPGGYQIFGITSDAGGLCCDCMRKNYRLISEAVRHKQGNGWRVVAFDHTGNYDDTVECDNCNKRMGGE
jgi:hypothetical protein